MRDIAPLAPVSKTVKIARRFRRRESSVRRMRCCDAGVSLSSSPAVASVRLALSKREASDALRVSVDFFEEHVMHELRIVRRGRRRLIPVRELARWLEASAELTLASFR